MARRAKGEGTLYQAKDKSWIYQYKLDGQRKTKRFQKKADAKAYIEALTAASPVSSVEVVGPARQQNAAPSEVITLGAWMDRWLENYARPTIKHSTYCSYELYVRAHIKPQIGSLYMNTLRTDDLQAFFNERGKNGNQARKGGLAPKTLTNMRNMMHMAFGQAVKNHLLQENLIEGIRLPKAAKAEMRVLSREEQRRLMTAARLAPEPAAFGIIFDMFTGLRLGELCGLRWENVDMENKSFLICETRNRLPNHDDSIAASTTVKTTPTTKTDNSRRRVFIMDELFHDFEMYKSIQMSIKEQDHSYNPEGYVFCQENGSPYEPRTYQDLFKRCIRQAGIPDANFHSLRHTFATRSLEQGMDVVTLSRLLGHANPSITLDKYGHALDDHKRVSVAKLGDIYSAKPEQKEPAPAPEDETNQMEMKMGW